MCKECAQERKLQVKLEEKRDVEDFIGYIEDYFRLNSSDEQKGIRGLYQAFKKQKSHRQIILIRIRSACLSPSTAMVYLPPLILGATGENKTNASATIIFLFIFLRKQRVIMYTPAV